MRKLTEHITNPANDKIKIIATGHLGNGGGDNRYEISGIEFTRNPLWNVPLSTADASIVLNFQNGPIPEAGVNGLTQEALLAIIADRLRGFQFQRNPDGTFDESKRGQYACKENACALTHVEEALHWLQSRTIKRMARGVEGTMAK